VARAFAVPLHAHVAPCAEGFLPATASLAAITPQSMVVSAIKGAEDGRGAILRFYNESREPGTAHIQLLLPVVRVTHVDLAERDGAVLFAGEPRTAFTVEAGPATIVSLRLEWG
jgi:alpha-mannosidase